MKTSAQIRAQWKALMDAVWQRGMDAAKQAHPATNGTPILVHNWGNAEARAALGRAQRRTGRIQPAFERLHAHAMHREQHGETFRPTWCRFCNTDRKSRGGAPGAIEGVAGHPKINAGALTVSLTSCGDPDHYQDPDQPVPGVPSLTVDVPSLEEASHRCRAYLVEHDLGSGNWAGGQVRDRSGALVARISYNGRIWLEPAGER